MQIELKIDGKTKTFKQDKVNFKTIDLATRWMKRFEEQQKMLAEMLAGELGDDFDMSEEVDALEDLQYTAELIVNFYDNQFTYDDLYNGLFVSDIREFYQFASDIFDYIQGRYEKKTKKPQRVAKK